MYAFNHSHDRVGNAAGVSKRHDERFDDAQGERLHRISWEGSTYSVVALDVRTANDGGSQIHREVETVTRSAPDLAGLIAACAVLARELGVDLEIDPITAREEGTVVLVVHPRG